LTFFYHCQEFIPITGGQDLCTTQTRVQEQGQGLAGGDLDVGEEDGAHALSIAQYQQIIARRWGSLAVTHRMVDNWLFGQVCL
jgi:hypothetical protein